MNLYKILQGIIDERGLSIAQVAKACDISDSTVRSIITRKQETVALEVAVKLSQGLGVSLAYLNGTEGRKQIEKAPDPGDAEPEAAVQERIKILTDAFTRAGWINPGGDISDEQFHFVKCVVLMLDEFFSR